MGARALTVDMKEFTELFKYLGLCASSLAARLFAITQRVSCGIKSSVRGRGILLLHMSAAVFSLLRINCQLSTGRISVGTHSA
jgi:hypothetical protein